jgi:ABC-2 type transport system ATP-binding protein
MLKITNLYKSYKTKEVLKGVTFSVQKGEIKGLIGVNGVGKSTLIECVCGVKKYDSGKIEICNMDVTAKGASKTLKYIVGYMPQYFNLFNDLTVEENLGYLCGIFMLDGKEIIEKILDVCFLRPYAKTLAQNLSGGYKQLLSLAAVLIHSPKILILDEPTSAMDPLFRKRFWKIINMFRESGVTILLITHHMEELIECDSFVCLSDGIASFEGNVKDFCYNGSLDIDRVYEKLIRG